MSRRERMFSLRQRNHFAVMPVSGAGMTRERKGRRSPTPPFLRRTHLSECAPVIAIPIPAAVMLAPAIVLVGRPFPVVRVHHHTKLRLVLVSLSGVPASTRTVADNRRRSAPSANRQHTGTHHDSAHRFTERSHSRLLELDSLVSRTKAGDGDRSAKARKEPTVAKPRLVRGSTIAQTNVS